MKKYQMYNKERKLFIKTYLKINKKIKALEIHV